MDLNFPNLRFFEWEKDAPALKIYYSLTNYFLLAQNASYAI